MPIGITTSGVKALHYRVNNSCRSGIGLAATELVTGDRREKRFDGRWLFPAASLTVGRNFGGR